MKNMRRLAAAFMAALVTMVSAPAAVSGAVSPDIVEIVRLGGETRFETANKIADEGWDSADNVFIANALSYADALAGAPLAYAYDAPILLTSGSRLTDGVRNEIKRLGAKNAYLLGGSAAVSREVENELRENGLEITRISGETRFETAVEIAKALMQKQDGQKAGTGEVFIASGVNYPDALSASPIAAKKGSPILYSPSSGALRQDTVDYIESGSVSKAYILGGTSAVGTAVSASLSGAGVGSTQRLGGKDRYETSLLIAANFDNVLSGADVSFATGANFPDALAGGVLAAKKGMPVLLTGEGRTDSALREYVTRRDPERAYVFGGQNAVSDDAVKNSLPDGKRPAGKSYTVTFNAGGADVTGMPAAVTVFENGKLSEPAAPSREGYIFTGWYSDAACSGKYDFSSPVTGDLTLYAGWEKNAGGQFEYIAGDDGGITLTAYKGTDAQPEIPDKLDGKPVTAIGESCFAGNSLIERVYIPEGVERVGKNAFERCGALRKVYFPDTMRTVSDGAFSGCAELTMADMHEGIASIGSEAFLGSSSLASIELPGSLEKLGESAFEGCGQLTRVTFRGETLDALPDRVFYGCADLSYISLPKSVKTVGERAFSGCSSLRSVYFAEPLDNVSGYAFEDCASLSSVYLRVSSLEPYTFKGCVSLKSFDTDGVTSIGFAAFAGSGIERIDLPVSSTDIAEGAFCGSSVRSVNVADGGRYQVIDGSLYSNGGRTLFAYFPGDPDADPMPSEFAVPDGVESIAAYAFAYHSELVKVALPASLKEIRAMAFSGTSLESIDVPAGVSVAPDAFKDSPLDTHEDAPDVSPSDVSPSDISSSDDSFRDARSAVFLR